MNHLQNRRKAATLCGTRHVHQSMDRAISFLGSTPVRAAALSKRLLMRIPTLTLLLTLYCGLASGCLEGVTRRTVAVVLSVKGDVVSGTTEKNNFQPVTRESRIPDGSIVRTSDGALLDLGLIAGALAQLSTNSEITIEELKISKDGNQTGDGMRSRSARIRLHLVKINYKYHSDSFALF
jgi:hypothetical protein